MLRFQELEDRIFLFLEEFEVDYSNNISERSFRFSKVRQSESKCFRTFEGFKMFAAISSILETAAKLGIDKLQMINEIFNGTAAQGLVCMPCD